MWLSPTGISTGPAGEVHIGSVSFKCVSSFLIDSTQVYRTSFMLLAVRLVQVRSRAAKNDITIFVRSTAFLLVVADGWTRAPEVYVGITCCTRSGSSPSHFGW